MTSEREPLLVSKSADIENNSSLTSSTKIRVAWTLPLVVLTYFLSYYTAVIIRSPYLYDQVAEEYHFKRNSSSQHPCVEHTNNTNSSQHMIEDEIQKEVSTLELYLSLSSYLCAAVSVLLVGPLTDRYGRRIGFLFPIIGTLIKQVVYVVTVVLHLSPMVLVAGHICESVGGSFAGMLSVMFAVISDVTEPGPRRSLLITAMEALQTLTGASAEYAIGQWIKTSYLHPILFSTTSGVISLFLAFTLLPETVQQRRLVAPPTVAFPGLCLWLKTRGWGVLTSGWRKFKSCFTLFLSDQSGAHHVLAKRRICLVVFILTVAVNFSTPGVQTLFLMKRPRCWPMSTILTFGSIQMVCNWVAILSLLFLLQKVFKMLDRHIAIIGVVSSMTSAVFMSLAINDVMVYEVAVLALMVRAIIPMLRSVLSSLVSPSVQGAVYASMGCVELVGAAVFGTVANRLYYATLSIWDGAVFLLFAAFMAVALVFLIILNLLYMRDQPRRDEVTQSFNSGNIQQASDTSW